MSTVCLHIGAMKSGTSFIQRVLSQNKQQLGESGHLFPGRRWRDQVLAVEEILDAGPKGKQRTKGAWNDLTAEINAFTGAGVIVSMEGMSLASSRDAQRIVESFPGHKVRIVVTARDLARVVPAQWQESIKNGATVDFGRYLAVASAPGARKLAAARPFWGPQDVPRILRTWRPLVGPEDLVLVTVPPRGAAPDELWNRFRDAAGLPPGEYDLDVRGNESLGVHSAELLRRLNRELDANGSHRVRQTVKQSLAKGLLAPHAASEPAIEVPEEYRAWVRQTADSLADEIADINPKVIGDLDDLRVPQWKDYRGGRLAGMRNLRHYADNGPSDAELLEVAEDALVGLTKLIAEKYR